MLNKRTQILFDPQMWNKLIDLARIKNISVGQLVREAVEEKYIESEKLIKRKKAIQLTLKTRVRFKGRIDYKELINHGRKY